VIGIAIAAAIAIVATVQTSPHLCNDSSRLAFADALVNHGTLAIDGTYFESTCDRLQRDGHFFSDKPPVLSLMLAGLLATLQTTFGWRIPGDLSALYPAITLLSCGVAWFAAFFGVLRFAQETGVDRRTAALIAAAGLSTTLFFVFTTTLNNHTIGGALLVWCLVAAARLLRLPDRPAWEMARLGGLSGLAVVIDPLSVSVAAPLVAVVAWTYRRRLGALTSLATGIVPVVIHVSLNLAVGGHPILTNIDPEAFAFAGSMHDSESMTGTGWKHDSLAAFAGYAFHSLFGHRGLFVYSPLAAAGIAGLVVAWRARPETERHPLAAALLVGLGLFVLLTVGFSNNYSGWAYGVRWHCIVIPVLVAGIALGDASLAAEHRNRWRWLCAALALAGVAPTAIGTMQPWTTMRTGAPQSSIRAVLSHSPVLVSAEARAAARMVRVGRNLEAQLLAGYALRRDPQDKRALAASIQAAAALHDRTAMRERWRQARAVPWSPSDYAHLERLATRILAGDEADPMKSLSAPMQESPQ